MKKLLALALALIMCLAVFAACAPTEEPVDTTTTAEPDDGTTTTAEPEDDGTTTAEPEDDGTTTTAPADDGETTTADPNTGDDEPTADELLDSAIAILDGLYKKEGVFTTSADYEIVGQVMIAGTAYPVTWTLDVEKEQIKLVQGSPYWTVSIDEESSEEIVYKLTASVTIDGTTETVTYERKVPKYMLTSFDDYINAEAGVNVVIKGIVVGINSKSLGNTRNHLFLADVNGKGGYYCYQLDADPVVEGVKLGMTVEVSAPTSPYNGMQETKGGTFRIVDETIKTVAPTDITEKFAAGESLKNYVGLVVTVKGVELAGQDLEDSHQYLYFKLNGKEAYVRSYLTDFPTTLVENGAVSATAKATMEADHAAHFGYQADVTGILILYSGAPYLIPTSVTPFTNYVKIEKTPAQMIEAEKEELKVADRITEDTTLTLPLVGKYYDDVTITWAIDNENYTIGEDGKLAIALGEEEVTLTLTATIKCGDTTQTQTFAVTVKAISKGVYVGEHVDTPVVNTAYKFYLYNATLKKNLYFDGTIDTKYLGTTENAADGVDVYLEAVLADDESVTGYRFYFMNGETKTYIDIISGGQAALATENPVAVYNYVAEKNIWAATVEGVEYYLGTYLNTSSGKTYTTISASKSSYINAENTGVTQYPAGFATLIAKKIEPAAQTTPVVDTAYKFYLYNATLEKNLYFNGTIDTKYLGTSTDPYDAVDVYVEAVLADDESVTGYRFYFMNGETKTYIDIISGGQAALATENPVAVYNYVAEKNIWAATVEGVEYYLGTYLNTSSGKTYTTISASKSSYINAENTGVTQYPAGFATMVVAESDDPTTPPAGGEGGGDGEGGGSTTPTVVTTIAEALTAADGTQILLTGTVKTAEAWNSDYSNMNFTLTDGTNDIYVFRVSTQVGVGDVVTVSGVMGTHYEKRQVAQGATITIDTPHVCTEYTGGSCTIAATCPVCGAEGDAAPGHNFVEGTCTECGESEQAAATNVTVSKTIAELITANGWTTTTTKQSFTLDDVVSVKVDGGSNSGKAYGGDHIRIYATDTPAGTLTISLAEGYELVSVKVSTKTGTYAFLQVDGGDGSDISNVETLVSGSSVLLNTVKNGDDGKQVQVTAIEVTYRPVSQ